METADTDVFTAGGDAANAEKMTHPKRMIAPSRHTPA